jgi:hypothetical protein
VISNSEELRNLCSLANVPPLSSGRIRKPQGGRWRRASPWYITTGDRQHGAGHEEARPSVFNGLLGGARRSGHEGNTRVLGGKWGYAFQNESSLHMAAMSQGISPCRAAGGEGWQG